MVLFHVVRKGGFLSFWAHRCSVTARRQFYVVASTLWWGKQNAIVTASGRLAQLVRALPSHGRGHWFESSIAHPQRYKLFGFRCLVRLKPEVPAWLHPGVSSNESDLDCGVWVELSFLEG